MVRIGSHLYIKDRKASIRVQESHGLGSRRGETIWRETLLRTGSSLPGRERYNRKSKTLGKTTTTLKILFSSVTTKCTHPHSTSDDT